MSELQESDKKKFKVTPDSYMFILYLKNNIFKKIYNFHQKKKKQQNLWAMERSTGHFPINQ